MAEDSVSDSSKPLRDPRFASGFESRFYPMANRQQVVASGTGQSLDWIQRDFLALYYHLNRCADTLISLRKLPRSLERRRMEAEILDEMNRYLKRREGMEESYYRFGYYVWPVLKNGLVATLQFSDHPMSQDESRRGALVRFTFDKITAR